MTNSMLGSIVACAAAFTTVLNGGAAFAAGDDWEKDWTALTVSSNGAWGTHTSPNRIEAMIGAMAQCRDRAGVAGSGCGSHIATVRAGWSLAYACGSETFIVTGTTLAEARRAAINREIELREVERVEEIALCSHLVAIGPDGELASSAMLSELLPFVPESSSATTSENLH
jgi:hypothetical protein